MSTDTMSGRVSPYNTRNVKQDVASAIVSSGLLGKFGGEILKETSGLHPTPKKKIVLPELPTQKKPKPPENILAKSPSLELHKKPLGAPSEPQTDITSNTLTPTTTTTTTTTIDNSILPNFNDTDINPEDLQPTNKFLTRSLSPRDNPATPTFPDTILHTGPTPSPNVTPGPNLVPPTSASPTKVGFGAKKSRLPKQETEHAEIPPTKIPEKYHMADQFPIRPHAVEEGESLAYSNQGWQKKWFPSDKPQGRREVLQLIHTFEMMLDDLGHQQGSGSTPPLTDIEKEQSIYDTILHEIIRQVTVECADRGILLEKVSRRYRRLFSRVPLILSEMQQEIDGLVDANKSLRILLERLMESKSEAEAQEKGTRNKILEVEELNNLHKQEIDKNNAIIEQLTKERDEAAAEAKRQVEKHYYQERLNSELLSKDEYNKATIRSLGKQLEDAINGLHDMEAKYLSVKSQQQEQQRRVSNLNASFSEELLRSSKEIISRESSETILKPPQDEIFEEDGEEEGEEEEEDEIDVDEEGRNQPRASTADVTKGRKNLQSKFTKAATFDTATVKRKSKGKDKEKEKEKESEDASQNPPRAKTPVHSVKKKEAQLQKPSSPGNKLRTSSRMPSGKGLQGSDEKEGSTTVSNESA